MTLAFGGLVLLSIGGVLFMSVRANFKNTFSLLNEQTTQMIASMERAISNEMDQVEFAISGLKKLHDTGAFDVNNAADRRKMIKSGLSMVQVIEAMQITDRFGQVTGYFRTVDGSLKLLPPRLGDDWGEIVSNSALSPNGDPVWTGREVRENYLLHHIVQNLYSGDQIVAQIRATIGGRSVNRLVSSLATDKKTTAFVLDDSGKLIAHSSRAGLFRGNPQLEVSQFPGLAMKQFAEANMLRGFVENLPEGNGFQVHGSRSESGGFFYITKPVKIFSETPYTLGAYFREVDITDELRRAGASAFIGVAALLLTLIAAIVLAHMLTKPMRRITDATNRFSRLELDGFEPLPSSRVKELNIQSGGINSMHTALSQFSKYVPQTLVRRILESGNEVTRPVERPVTVMFTDIADFTAGSEMMDAAAITSMLNNHFELISRKVAQSHGTVDKYLGDGVMAFWGAPETDDEHAAHAIEAAIAIKQAFEAECDERRSASMPSLHLRIGIHTGRAIVGNIGGDDRTNYTVIGHTVNVANRIEQLGKSMIEGSDVVVSVSQECFAEAGSPPDFMPAGAHMIRGSSKPVTIFVHQTGHSGNLVDLHSSTG